MTLLQLDNIPAMQDEVRALARERGAVILAHNYQLPEIQDVADYVGDSLGLSIKAAAAVAQVDGRAELEASGGVTPETVVVYSTIKGLHYVSMGALTHSAPNLDLSLLLEFST